MQAAITNIDEYKNNTTEKRNISRTTCLKVKLGDSFADFVEDLKNPSLTADKISFKYNIGKSTVARYRCNMCAPSRLKNNKVSKAMKNEMVIMSNEGMKLVDIAKKLGVSSQTVSYHLRKEGIYHIRSLNKALKDKEATEAKLDEAQTELRQSIDDVTTKVNGLSKLIEAIQSRLDHHSRMFSMFEALGSSDRKNGIFKWFKKVSNNSVNYN